MSLCQSANEVPDAAPALGADAAFATPRGGRTRLRVVDVNAAGITARGVEWCQGRCENWCQVWG
jgi:hypothetical protein